MFIDPDSAWNLSNLLQKAKTVNTKGSQHRKRGTLWLWGVSLCTQSFTPLSELKRQHLRSTEIYHVCMPLSCSNRRKRILKTLQFRSKKYSDEGFPLCQELPVFPFIRRGDLHQFSRGVFSSACWSSSCTLKCKQKCVKSHRFQPHNLESDD